MFTTDKIEHGFLPFYLAECARISERAQHSQIQLRPVVLELGVRDGSSLQMWRALMPKAIVIGVDNSDQANTTVHGTDFIKCDQSDPGLFEKVRDVWRRHYDADVADDFGDPFVDLLVDDASHDGQLSSLSFAHLWPLVKPGGLYVIEDWYVGGPEWPSYDRSMLDLAEQLVSLALDDQGPALSIEYRYGLIAVRKRPL